MFLKKFINIQVGKHNKSQLHLLLSAYLIQLYKLYIKKANFHYMNHCMKNDMEDKLSL